MDDSNQLPVLQAEGRVLSTLESDGRRRWLYPKLSTGRFWSRRRVVAYSLIAVYTLLPFIKIGGRPAIQLDIWNGRFSLLGLQFRPTDLELLAVFGLMVGLTIFFLTAILGRVWCGWACPQTVYLEFVFRPIERLFMGTAGKGGKPKQQVAGWRTAAMYLAFFLICLHLANTFLSYFVGVAAMNEWIWSQPPWRHPGAFLLVMLVTGLMLFDFCYWREQLCIIGCPYGRFQSVLLDRSSLVVGYDKNRGEPRGHGRDRAEKGLGSCVDCGMCVDVCPTGIDIRDGLQLECVNCTQCIDACDSVMDRIKQPRGLIRYSSQLALEGKPTRIVRPRVLIYSGVIVLLAGVFVALLVGRKGFDVTLLRGMGRPFVVTASGDVENIVRVKLVNRVDEERTYRIEAVAPASLRLDGGAELRIASGETVTEPVHLLAPPEAFVHRGGTFEATLRFTDSGGETIERSYNLFGPATSVTKPLEAVQ
ncbi:Ubp3 associated protein Bre5 [Botrimarina colliarenosi]|uniref:Ubp3 associated protein Bre5 n=1 Tax=Botrimarina colliarenosi TaxID=2528001 RepID=A0A5C6ADP5_9BACT|nr:cytochrome c oxidase accessory protein CcoG [Botrimarina colliarenosi]TWT97560.1 Ubp3 associated protein Bre5 [Botrimarina colliarenosi]